jgi:hypothetical protein
LPDGKKKSPDAHPHINVYLSIGNTFDSPLISLDCPFQQLLLVIHTTVNHRPSKKRDEEFKDLRRKGDMSFHTTVLVNISPNKSVYYTLLATFYEDMPGFLLRCRVVGKSHGKVGLNCPPCIRYETRC